MRRAMWAAGHRSSRCECAIPMTHAPLVDVRVPQEVARAVRDLAYELAPPPPGAPGVPIAEWLVAQVRQAREDLDEVVLVRDRAVLVVVDDGHVVGEGRMHVEGDAFAGRDPDRLVKVERHEPLEAARVRGLVDERPLVRIDVRVVLERAAVHPHRQRAELPPHAEAVHLEELDRPGLLHRHAEHDAAKSVIFPVARVDHIALVDRVVGGLPAILGRRHGSVSVRGPGLDTEAGDGSPPPKVAEAARAGLATGGRDLRSIPREQSHSAGAVERYDGAASSFRSSPCSCCCLAW
mmetsp:Transcript_5265/g.11719  ORF Transcript_5265/g.11719 Transcript_5265/m.11719 type:complete len:293 (-) Transcript_5265:13-891(-)